MINNIEKFILELKEKVYSDVEYELINIINSLLELNNLTNDISTQKGNINLSILKSIRDYKNKAKLHLYYLKCIMFISMCILWEYNYFTRGTFYIVSFLILFNIAFIENMLYNLTLNNFKDENRIILEKTKKINEIKFEQN